MPEPETTDLETRVRDLEREVFWIKANVDVTRNNAEAARRWIEDTDPDGSEVRAPMRLHVVYELRETQQEHGRQMADLRSDVVHGFGDIRAGVAEIAAHLGIRGDKDAG